MAVGDCCVTENWQWCPVFQMDKTHTCQVSFSPTGLCVSGLAHFTSSKESVSLVTILSKQ